MRLAAAMLTGMLIAAPGLAQEAKAPPQPAPVPDPGPQQKPIKRAKLNQETLVIAASRPGTAYLAMVSDLSSAIGSSGNVRVLAVAADGALANLRDLLFLLGVDALDDVRRGLMERSFGLPLDDLLDLVAAEQRFLMDLGDEARALLPAVQRG